MQFIFSQQCVGLIIIIERFKHVKKVLSVHDVIFLTSPHSLRSKDETIIFIFVIIMHLQGGAVPCQPNIVYVHNN